MRKIIGRCIERRKPAIGRGQVFQKLDTMATCGRTHKRDCQQPAQQCMCADMRRLAWCLVLVAAVGLLFTGGAASQGEKGERPEATSLLGRSLYAPRIPHNRVRQLEAQLAEARATLAKTPDDVEAILWMGRRTAYLGRFREAIAIYSDGLRRFPNHPKLLRHRGHRYLTVREIDRAIADFEAAARATRGMTDEIEPDGAPNARNVPRSTLQTNIWYHLGLGYYLKGDFANAERGFSECLALSKNDDMAVAARYWLYLSRMRAGQRGEATRVLESVRAGMDIVENDSYYQLLLLYKGKKMVDALATAMSSREVAGPTTSYGIGAWHLVNGRGKEARAVFEKIVAGEQWAAFGFLAAEAEVARRRGAKR